MACGKSLAALLALLFVVSAVPASLGDVLDQFSGGLSNATITFPQNGGSNSSMAIEMPRHAAVSSAYIEMEGRPKSFGSASGFVDFSSGAATYAYDGTASAVPPKGKPSTLEGNNISSDAALRSSDDRKVPAKAPSSVPYHHFVFDMSETRLDNFDFMWEGLGQVHPDAVDDPYSAVELYVYNCATGSWDKTDSYYFKGEARDDYTLWASVRSGAASYPDERGKLCFIAVATPPVSGSYTGYIETDYVSLQFNGTRMLYPENVKLDLKGDGTVEWSKTGQLRGKVNFTGDKFVSALQAILDGSLPGTVKIPLKFTSDKGGILFVSNLSIAYDLRNLPPEKNGAIPLVKLDEDTDAASALDLRNWFKDDAGAANLTYSIVYQSDSTKVEAKLNASGHTVDLFTKEPDWHGNQRFRARATDVEGLTADNEFEVSVLSVNDPPRLKTAGALVAHQDVPFTYTFSATDVDMALDLEETVWYSTNATFLDLDPETGQATFTPRNADVGTLLFSVTANDRYGATDTRNFTLRVENRNDPPSIQKVSDQTVLEDQPFELRLNATDADLAIGQDSLRFEDSSPLFTVTQEGLISFTPQNKDVGDHPVSVWVTDAGGLKAWANFTIKVVNVNDPPVLSAVADQTVEEDKELSVRAVASDEDAGDVLTFSTDNPLVKVNATGWISFKPAQREVGVHRVNLTVRDSSGAAATVRFNITVLNVNDPPRNVRIASPANRTVFQQGAPINFTGNATDDDGDALEMGWYSGEELLGTGASFSTKELSPGVHTIVLKADDGSGPVSSDPLEITVEKKKAPAAASKGFIPGFGAAAAAAAVALGAVAAGLARKRKN